MEWKQSPLSPQLTWWDSPSTYSVWIYVGKCCCTSISRMKLFFPFCVLNRNLFTYHDSSLHILDLIAIFKIHQYHIFPVRHQFTKYKSLGTKSLCNTIHTHNCIHMTVVNSSVCGKTCLRFFSQNYT